MTDYQQFLRRKIARAENFGFAPVTPPHESLFGHQRDLAEWLCRGGRRACFADFGLGKTRINLQVAKWTTEHHDGKYLIIAPLGVRQEFTLSDGPAMGLDVKYVSTMAEAKVAESQILITNYERARDGDIDPGYFIGCGLDEASCLRSYGSKTYQTFLSKFANVKYKHVYTATPSPNRYKELIHYGGFLGVMDTGQALTRFFQRDSEKAGNLTLMPHMEDKFWTWLNSWAVFLQKPSDLGYSDEGYDLPPLKVHWHRIAEDYSAVQSTADSWGQYQLIPTQSRDLRKSAEHKRSSISIRAAAAKAIIATEPEKHWLVWHNLENERERIEQIIPGIETIYGSMDLDERESKLMDFSNGKIKIFGSKPQISGSGCNFQRHCADMIFLGLDYKFNDFIQSIHRCRRFQQSREVHVHIIHLESEDEIRAVLESKWRKHDELMQRMAEIVRQNGLSNISYDAERP